jgi:hypothetical protein
MPRYRGPCAFAEQGLWDSSDVNQKLTPSELDDFLAKSANYILAEVIGVQLKWFILTTPDYRVKSRCLKPLMKNTSNSMLPLFGIRNEEDIRREAKQRGLGWAREYIDITDCLGVPRLGLNEEIYVVDRWAHDIVELRQSGQKQHME